MRIARIYIPLFLLMLLLNYASAQQDSKNYLGLSFGGSDFHIKDEKASPLVFRSFGIAPSVHYVHKGEKSHHVEISYFDSDLKASSDNFHTINRGGKIRYSYLQLITDFSVFDKNIRFFLGGSAGSFLTHNDYYYTWFNGGDARAYESWYWSTTLDISAQLEYHPAPREFFSLQFFIPLVSNVSRPNFSSSYDYNYIDNDWKFKMFGETEFFPENFSLGANILYQRALIWNLNMLLNYEFHYSSFEKPKTVNMYMNNFRAGLVYCF